MFDHFKNLGPEKAEEIYKEMLMNGASAYCAWLEVYTREVSGGF